MNLTIDIGNTYTKLGFFRGLALVTTLKFSNSEQINWQSIIGQNKVEKSILSRVNKKEEKFDELRAKTQFIEANHSLQLPFTSDYKPFISLGIDRVVALAASTSLYPNQNVLVIDAGSCITYDLITQDAHHLGGSISPGIEMRYRSMSTFTDQLPKLSLAEIEGFAPTTTQDAMHHGVISGIIAEIDAFVLEYGKLVPNFTIILTGGDASFLSNRVKNGILADANFLAFGLNMLLETNKS